MRVVENSASVKNFAKKIVALFSTLLALFSTLDELEPAVSVGV
jgi:hypothetical protein